MPFLLWEMTLAVFTHAGSAAAPPSLFRPQRWACAHRRHPDRNRLQTGLAPTIGAAGIPGESRRRHAVCCRVRVYSCSGRS